MKTMKTIGGALIIIGFIVLLFTLFDPRVSTPVFQNGGAKFVLYRQAVVTNGSGAVETYDQVVLLVSSVVTLPDTKVTISGTAYPIESGNLYYFSGYYFYMPTYYRTAGKMSIGDVVYTNVYTLYSEKYSKLRDTLQNVSFALIIVGVIVYISSGVSLGSSEKVSEEKEVEVGTIGSDFYSEEEEKEEEENEEVEEEEEKENVEVVEDVDIFLPVK